MLRDKKRQRGRIPTRLIRTQKTNVKVDGLIFIPELGRREVDYVEQCSVWPFEYG